MSLQRLRLLVTQSAFAVAMLVVTTSTYAGIIDFDDPSAVAGSSGSFIDSDGFRFTLGSTGGFLEVGQSRDLGGLFNANSAEFTMSAIDGSLFDLLSFDFARRENDTTDQRSAEVINITGTLGGGGTVSYTTGGLLDAFTQATLPSSFVGLTSVFFDPVVSTIIPANPHDREFVVDNISVLASTVPEPATLALLGISLFGMGLARRKKV